MQTVLCQPFAAQPKPKSFLDLHNRYNRVIGEDKKIAARKEAAVEAAREEIQEEIVEVKQEIQRLQEELQEEWDELERCEREEYDLEPEPGNDVTFDGMLPTLEEDFNGRKIVIEVDILALECEIAELEAKRGKL